jgi:hypothetical protein
MTARELIAREIELHVETLERQLGAVGSALRQNKLLSGGLTDDLRATADRLHDATCRMRRLVARTERRDDDRRPAEPNGRDDFEASLISEMVPK